MGIGALSCIALIFWWDTTLLLGGTERSIVLYLASFGLSIVDCTSSVVFLPYMARFKGHHLIPYLIGEGLSGFLPSLIVLAQGVTEEGQECLKIQTNTSTALQPEEISLQANVNASVSHFMPSVLKRKEKFSANIFFLSLLIILLISWISFILMDGLLLCKSERIDIASDVGLELEPSVKVRILPDPDNDDTKNVKSESGSNIKLNSNSKIKLSPTYIWLLGLMCWGCFTTFGAMPSLQSYSCLPYSADTFFYAVTFAGLTYPVACFLAFFRYPRSHIAMNTLTLIGSGIGVYILICAMYSSNPPLKMELAGSAIMIGSWISYVGIVSYVKTIVSLELNRLGGNEAMFWCGFVQQLGAASGGAIIFCVINFTSVFKEEDKLCE